MADAPEFDPSKPFAVADGGPQAAAPEFDSQKPFTQVSHGGEESAGAPNDKHDLVPFLKNAGSGLLDSVGNAVAHPIDTAKNVADFAGSAVEGFGKGLIAGPSDLNKVPDQDEQNFVGAMSGVPTFAPITLAHTYLQSRAAGNSAEDALKDARNVGVLLGGMKLAGAGMSKAAGAAGGALAKEAGVSPEAIARYRANPEAVNAAKPLVDTTKDFLADADARQAAMSQASSDSFATLKDAGTTGPENISQPIQAQIDRLRSLGVFGPERKAAINFLNGIIDDVHGGSNIPGSDFGQAFDEMAKTDAPDISAATEPLPQEIGLDKGKAVLNALDSHYEKLSANPGADPQVLKAISDARGGIDSYLKQKVPAYGSQMETLAGQAQDYAGLANKFRTDQGAMSTLKRIQTGKDPFAADALQNYDQQFGTSFGEDLKNSAAAQQFERPTTNGSRKTLLGGAVGNVVGHAAGWLLGDPAAGGQVGMAVGAGAGFLADRYGGQAVKVALDAWIKLDRLQGTKFLGPIMAAAKAGPQQLAVAHYVMAQQNPDYQKLLEGGDEDRPPPHKLSE